MIEIRLLGPGDAGLVEKAADDVFDSAVNAALTAEFLADPRHHICGAIDDGILVGFASAVHYVHPDKRAQLWVNEVGVAERHQRRGLAQAMLQKLIPLAADLGCAEAWVLTDESNAAARALSRGRRRRSHGRGYGHLSR